MLTIWGRINSHNVKKVVWLAEEIGLDYRRIDIGGPFGFTSEYLVMNPNRLIPTIEDDGIVLWESNAILRYLAHRYGTQFLPEDPCERAAGDKWMDWQFHFADAQRDAFHGLIRHRPEDRNQNAIDASAAKSGAMMALLEAELATRPWLSGRSFGIADIPMAVYAHTFLTLPIERPDLPHLVEWYQRLLSRPPFACIAAVPLT